MENEKYWVHISCRGCGWQVLKRLGAVEEHCPRCRGDRLHSSLVSETAARRVLAGLIPAGACEGK